MCRMHREEERGTTPKEERTRGKDMLGHSSTGMRKAGRCWKGWPRPLPKLLVLQLTVGVVQGLAPLPSIVPLGLRRRVELVAGHIQLRHGLATPDPLKLVKDYGTLLHNTARIKGTATPSVLPTPLASIPVALDRQPPSHAPSSIALSVPKPPSLGTPPLDTSFSWPPPSPWPQLPFP